MNSSFIVQHKAIKNTNHLLLSCTQGLAPTLELWDVGAWSGLS